MKKTKTHLNLKLTKAQEKELQIIFKKHDIDTAFLSKIFQMKSAYRFTNTSSTFKKMYALYHFYKKINPKN